MNFTSEKKIGSSRDLDFCEMSRDSIAARHLVWHYGPPEGRTVHEVSGLQLILQLLQLTSIRFKLKPTLVSAVTNDTAAATLSPSFPFSHFLVIIYLSLRVLNWELSK